MQFYAAVQFRQFAPEFAFAFSQLFRNLDLNDNVKITAIAETPGSPRPRKRKRWPPWVPGGIFRRTFPSRVGTSNSPPSTACHGSIFSS